jgi:hypothetical protein
MPAAFAQLGACVSGAQSALNGPSPDLIEARRLLTLARKHGAEIGREWLLPGYETHVAQLDDDDWGTPG